MHKYTAKVTCYTVERVRGEDHYIITLRTFYFYILLIFTSVFINTSLRVIYFIIINFRSCDVEYPLWIHYFCFVILSRRKSVYMHLIEVFNITPLKNHNGISLTLIWISSL